MAIIRPRELLRRQGKCAWWGIGPEATCGHLEFSITWGCKHEHLETWAYCLRHADELTAKAVAGTLFCEACSITDGGPLVPVRVARVEPYVDAP